MPRLIGVRPTALPLRLRLTLWYTASLGLILCLLAAFLYLQLQRSLLSQVDVGLEVVAAQALINLDEEGDRLAFQSVEDNSEGARVLNDDVVLYLLAPDGSIWDRLGSDDDAPLDARPTAGHMTLSADGEGWRVYNQPLTISATAGWLQVVQELEVVEQTLQSLLTQMLFGVPIALILAAAGGFFLASRALRPIDRITSTAQAINAHDLHQRLDYSGPADEVGRLAATFDQMLGRLHSAFERERRFTGDAAHELRTPLTALKGRIGVTLSQPRQELAYIEALREMEQQVDRLIRLSNDLLFMARLDQEHQRRPAELIGVSAFLGAVIDQVRPLAEAKAITLTAAISPGLIIQGHFDLLVRLFLNLLDNAIKYTPVNGRVIIQAQQQAQIVQVAIRDSGPGIAPAHLPHLFERFYRAEDDRARPLAVDGQGGAGLGLALAHEIARTHGGKLSVQSEVGQGTTFFVQLPI